MTSRPTMFLVFSDAASVANRMSERRASSTGSATNVQSSSAPAFGAVRAVGDLHAEAGEAPRHLGADAAEAEDAGALAVHAALQGIAALGRPGAGPHPGVGADHAARQRQHHGDAEIGDVPGQHVGRVGDADAARPRGGEVDRIEADAINGNDLERGQGVDQRAAGAELAARGDGANIFAMPLEQRGSVALEVAMHGEALVQPLLVRRGIGAHLQDRDLVHQRLPAMAVIDNILARKNMARVTCCRAPRR